MNKRHKTLLKYLPRFGLIDNVHPIIKITTIALVLVSCIGFFQKLNIKSNNEIEKQNTTTIEE